MPTSVSDSPAVRPKALVSVPHIVLSFIGLGVALYSVRVHNIAKAGGDTGCGISETISCDKVLTSAYASIFGIPLGVYGALFWIIVLLTAFSSDPKTTPRRFALTHLAIAAVGFASSVALLYISKAIIKAYCPVCLVTHLTTTTLFLVSLFRFFKVRRNEQSAA